MMSESDIIEQVAEIFRELYSQGYEHGHNDTVESMYCDSKEQFNDYWNDGEYEELRQQIDQLYRKDLVSDVNWKQHKDALIFARKDERTKTLEAIPTVEQLINGRKFWAHCKSWTVGDVLDELIELDKKYRSEAIKQELGDESSKA